MELKTIAKINTAHKEKFGIPRQSGMVELPAKIVFEPEYRDINAVRGLEGYSHIWVLWHFSKVKQEAFQPTVRPPRLGGNKRMGVFATRSPNRPNPIGLSCLKLEKVEITKHEGPVLLVSGADILDGTPIFDIKPYITFSDSRPNAVCGFSEDYKEYKLKVEIDEEKLILIEENFRKPIIVLLACDPRPSYQNDPERIYGLLVSGYSIKFTVFNGILTVKEVIKESN